MSDDWKTKYIVDMINPESFSLLWGKDKNFSDHDDVVFKLKSVCELFFNGSTYASNLDNTYHNEIRERGLFTIFYNGGSVVTLYKDNVDRLEELYNKWNSTVVICIEKYCIGNGLNVDDYQVESLTMKGGQGFSYDFELIIKNKINSTSEIVKIELKFSSKNVTKIKDLAQFNAIVTESKTGLLLFGEDNSYLDFFWDNGYFHNMCDAIEYSIPDGFEKELWKKSAKGQKPKKSHPVTIPFHDYMREIGKKHKLYNIRREIVGTSYDPYIHNGKLHAHLSKPETLQQLTDSFHSAQDDKVYCIFNKGEFYTDMIDKTYNIVDFKLDSYDGAELQHTFVLVTEGENMIYNIQCEMSWGNGGHGNNNPRVRFKLIDKPGSGTKVTKKRQTSSSSNEKKKKKQKGGEENEDDDYSDNYDADIELAIGDNETANAIKKIKGETDETINLSDYMQLRSGRLIKKPSLTVGGKRSIAQKYVPKRLSKKDKKKQLREIKRSRKAYKNRQCHTRKKVKSFKSKKIKKKTKKVKRKTYRKQSRK